MSLLDEGNSDAPVTLSGESQEPEGTSENKSSWYWDENTPGTGERPAYLPEKYKTVADVAKAQRELESRLGHAPSEYDFSRGESWMEPDYEPFQQMAEFAKSKHVPQEVMDKMLDSVGLYLDEFKTDLNEEKAKLGEKAGERLQVLNNWAKANLSERSFNALTAGMRTAESIEALEEIRNKMLSGNTMIPSGNAGITQPGMTMDAYRSELNANYDKYKTDAHYRKEMDGKLESILSRGK